jgi:Ca-activated chloride channel homolog
MNRRSIPKWASLTAICIVAIFSLSGIVHHESAEAAGPKPRQQTSGSLRVVDRSGKKASECPLKHTDVKAQVSGFLSRVTVTQDFENPFPDKIEAVYTFPLPEAAAVDDLTMLIGDRTIKGKIMRRQDAQTTYAAAKQMGQIASLLDQERPNIFTQQVANIMPGQQIRITISYVETLKYEDGSYQWIFPMVVAPLYTPEGGAGDQSNSSSRIAPPRLPEGMRAGHDVSLEIDLDAGVPIVALNSETHETEVQQKDEKHAVVQLKDRVTIPNKDFILTYRVAGDNINDAVLTHRSDRGGFFTLILQPPQRVTSEDVMPKEIVFVLDTSGSMSGFPIETAKQTMQLALDTLYSHDTFNLITFAGDTEILFPNPVPATPENLRMAKKFLASREGNGSTEMMKAIKAAFDPSDSQYHIRLACFMTDGQVGNEQEILAEIQKHSNARVFAMGFGDAPNRSLLDKMSAYGRGEVNYVLATSGSKDAARRFNDRIRNPLLTDLSIDWSDLPITEIYPRRIPDLFSVKPVIVSGRYAKGAKGTIRLKGKMAGQDFVREIPVELPEVENDHDVLATLWARRRIDDLMEEEIANAADKAAQDQKREEITELGLTFKLMTQYTSFVAVDDVIFTGGDEPRRVEVPVEALPGSIVSGVTELVMVTSSATTVNASASQIQNVSHAMLQNLPLQGRNLYSLFSLAPGSVASYDDRALKPYQTNFSINGQRPNSNEFNIDGVSGNFGIAAGGESPGASASGSTPALTASGGANGISAVGASAEVTIRTSYLQPEYGRTSGGQINVTTKSGTNEFHGSAFHFFGNDSLDATGWFANRRGLKQAPKRLNIFGATLGGPIERDKTFFFASYEGMRLRQPVTSITDVPSLASRESAPIERRSFLAAFPAPNGFSRSDGFAEFAATFANPARHDVGSLRIDHSLNNKTTLSGRYNFADSNAALRGTDGLSLNTVNRLDNRVQTLTGSLTRSFSPNVVLDLRANYSRSRLAGSYELDEFGGALVPAGLSSSFVLDLNSRNAGLRTGDKVSSLQRQINIAGSMDMVFGTHSFKVGGDYRRLSPVIGVRSFEENVFFDGMGQAMNGIAARVSSLNFNGPQNPVFESLSLFAQDEWRQTSRLTWNYGLRWELAPPPSTAGEQAFAVDQVTDPATLKVDPSGSSLWKTTFANFAPRAGVAYQLSQKNNYELVLRSGLGVLYDLNQNRSGDVFANSIPFISGSALFNTPYPMDLPATTSDGLPLIAFDPQLKVPYTIRWDLELQQGLGSQQSINVSYVGSAGKRLLHTETLFDQNPDFDFLRLVTNRGSSDYRALQVIFDRRFSDGLEALVSYAWARSLDNLSEDSARRVLMTSIDPQFDRGPSDFDLRHQLTGFISYAMPAPIAQGVGNKLFRNWTVDSIFIGRTAKPLNVFYVFPTSFGVAYFRPDVVNGASLYLYDPAVAGGRRLNSAAFLVPANLQQGNLARNSLRGFPLYQIDLALRRKFSFSEDVALQIQGDAFNVFNHPNFEDPLGNDLVIGSASRSNLAFGESTSLSGRSSSGGGFGSLNGFGGARTLRLSVKLLF